MQIKRGTVWAFLALALAGPVNAEGLPNEPGPARTVKMFDTFCVNLLPKISRIAEVAAAGDFTELKGKELEKHQPQVRAEELRAWSYKDFGSEFVLTTARTNPDAQFKKEVPQFSDTKALACSLTIPANEPKAKVLKEMVSLVSRDPNETWNLGPFRVHSWAGQTDSLLILFYFYAPTKEGQNGVLSALTFINNQGAGRR